MESPCRFSPQKTGTNALASLKSNSFMTLR